MRITVDQIGEVKSFDHRLEIDRRVVVRIGLEDACELVNIAQMGKWGYGGYPVNPEITRALGMEQASPRQGVPIFVHEAKVFSHNWVIVNSLNHMQGR